MSCSPAKSKASPAPARRHEDVRTPISLSNGIVHFFRQNNSLELAAVEAHTLNLKAATSSTDTNHPKIVSRTRTRKYDDLRTPASLSNGIFTFYRRSSLEFSDEIDTNLPKMKKEVVSR